MVMLPPSWHPTPTHATFASAKPCCHPPHSPIRPLPSFRTLQQLHFHLPVQALCSQTSCFPLPFLQVFTHHGGIAQVVFSLVLQLYQPGRASGGRRAQAVEDQLPSKYNCINKPYYIYIYFIFFLLLYIVNGCGWPDRIFLQTVK